MFTGIVEALGTVDAIDPRGEQVRLRVRTALADSLDLGASIAVNGVCLTAVDLEPGVVALDVVPETLRRTNLGALAPGDPVDLERPMAADGRFDGHIVQGHVDAVARVLDVQPEGEGRRMRIALPEALARYVVEKGSITVDGVSLTVAATGDEPAPWFEVALIPHTLDVTVLGIRENGDLVNLEVDVIAKYVARMMEAHR